MPSRISGACNGCRSKKQKCSGDRTPPGCAQCVAAGVGCTWPEQRKRGPSKGYIEALESRLNSAETLLLALLPSTDQRLLDHATERIAEDSGDGEERRTSPALLNKKTGVDYWDAFPLDSSDDVRRWQRDCEIHSRANSQAYSVGQPHGGRLQVRSDHVRSHTRGGSDDYRSSMAAATAIAGMRNGTGSPNTPLSTSSRTFEPVPSPMSVAGRNSSSLPQRSHNDWTQPPEQSLMPSSADQKRSSSQHTHAQWPDMTGQPRLETDSDPVVFDTQNRGLYPEDFPQNLFW